MMTAQVEPWEQALPELRPLFEDHWRELALNQEKVPLAVNYGIYAALDRAGQLLVVTLRDAGRVVGYFMGIVAPGLHYSTCLECKMDIFRVLPEARGRHAGTRLFRAVEAECKRRGVQRMFNGSKLHRDSGRLFAALGYTPVETYYSKWIGD
jgi:GNAT superfamily N-acetyltransferase